MGAMGCKILLLSVQMPIANVARATTTRRQATRIGMAACPGAHFHLAMNSFICCKITAGI